MEAVPQQTFGVERVFHLSEANSESDEGNTQARADSGVRILALAEIRL